MVTLHNLIVVKCFINTVTLWSIVMVIQKVNGHLFVKFDFHTAYKYERKKTSTCRKEKQVLVAGPESNHLLDTEDDLKRKELSSDRPRA